MILITTNLTPPSVPHGFPCVPVLTLLLERDNAKLVQDAIIRQVKAKHPKSVNPMKCFELTARESWKLLEKEADWSLTHYREVLKSTFVEDVTEEKGAGKMCRSCRVHFCNVIVFGDSGAGKTFVIRMLTDECEIDTKKGSSAGDSTSKSQAYDIDIRDYHFRIHERVGLDDETSASMPPKEARRNIYQLQSTTFSQPSSTGAF